MKKITFDEKALAVIEVFNKSGYLFTMDELASALNISKRTLYKKIESKEDALRIMIDYTFKEIKRKQQEILESNHSSLSKAISLMAVNPTTSVYITSDNMNYLSENYSVLYDYIVELLESDWDVTFELMDQSVLDGELNPFNKELFKSMYVHGLTFVSNNNYESNLSDILEILLNGIRRR